MLGTYLLSLPVQFCSELRTGSQHKSHNNAVSSTRAEGEPPERASLRGRCLACTASEHSLMWISLAMPCMNRFHSDQLRRSGGGRWQTGCSAST